MLPSFRFAPLFAAAALLFAAPAAANDDAAELWFNPSISYALDDDTGVEFETAQRLRSEADGRADTYYSRLWVNQDLSDAVTLSGGVERRINDPGANETRFLQQVSTRHGILRTRNRLEQRFVDGGRMGLRLRSRLGVDIPLGEERSWAFVGNAELFLTLRSTSSGGDDGLTGLRTQLGLSHDLTEEVALTLAYLRQQDFENGAPDRVGHAPLLGIELSF
jgi:hypothetical protein